ncbi:MAG: hypothetical protein E6Q32_06220 [Neisseriales bacterium]|nr:MAG: hypothetical protein E6Q32_06220 [Neisseriales bacterium]
MLSDQEFISKVINGFKQFDSYIDNWCTLVRAADLTIIYSSPLYNKVFKCDDSIIGQQAFIVTNDKHFAEQNEFDKEKIIKQRQKIRTLAVTEYHGIVQPFSLEKSPLINPDTNNVVGIYCYYEKLSFSSLQLQILRSLDIYKYSYDVDIAKYKLTQREKEAIFLFLAGLGSEDIASILAIVEGHNISKSAIDSLFRNQLFVKFEVYSRKALFDKLLNLGFDHYIPQSLLTKVELTIPELITY